MDEIATSIATQPRRLRGGGDTDTKVLPPAIAAVERMSDSTGMLQHSIYSVPDRRHGYCIDDNARALMLMSAVPELTLRWPPTRAGNSRCWNYCGPKHWR